MTVALLDRMAPLVRERLGVGAADFPLARMLEGGSWVAGRRIAAERRAGRRPALQHHQRRNGVLDMQGLTIVDHPLVQHKLTLLRDRNISTQLFRTVVREIATLLCYEVTRDLPTEIIGVETPIATARSPTIAGKKLVIAPVLRAGLAMADGMLDLVPSARIAHIGLYRDPITLQAVEYYFKAPEDVPDRRVIVVDPMLATGHTAIAALDLLKEAGVDRPAFRLPARLAPRRGGGARRPSRRAGLGRGDGPGTQRSRLYRARPGRCRRPDVRYPLGSAFKAALPASATAERWRRGSC